MTPLESAMNTLQEQLRQAICSTRSQVAMKWHVFVEWKTFDNMDADRPGGMLFCLFVLLATNDGETCGATRSITEEELLRIGKRDIEQLARKMVDEAIAREAVPA